jgi:Helix-turn-helix domain
MYEALKRSSATDTTLLVLLVLASYADKDGLCYPSLRELARKARLSRQTVVTAIEKLVHSGELVRLTRRHTDWDRIKHRRRAGGFQPTNYYELKVVQPVDYHQDGPNDQEVVQPVDHQGGPTDQRKVAQTAETTLLSLNLSLEQGGAARREPCKWDGKLREMVHRIWQEQPLLSGVELLEHLRSWLEQEAPSIAKAVTDEDLGAAIEDAGEQRRWSASMRRPHQQRKRA